MIQTVTLGNELRGLHKSMMIMYDSCNPFTSSILQKHTFGCSHYPKYKSFRTSGRESTELTPEFTK